MSDAKAITWRWQIASGAIYALFVFTVPVLSGGNVRTWALTVVSFVAFALLYRDFFYNLPNTRRQVVDVCLIGSVGFALIPFNLGGTTYVAYAAALAPFPLRPRHAIAFFCVLAALLWLQLLLISDQNRVVVGVWVTLVLFIVGFGNLFISDRIRQMTQLRRAHQDVEEMAKVAERERIARDLHDLLGHTLSVIALKSELASKLADRDPVRATEEIREVERVSRDALAEVRAAVEGYKKRGFSGEILEARRVLASAGVRLDAEVGDIALLPRQETVLALALRESVTNVVRHARASVCRVMLGLDRGDIVLTVQDDGSGGVLREGNGLAGMRERVTGSGGTLNVDAGKGFTVSVRFPSVSPS